MSESLPDLSDEEAYIYMDEDGNLAPKLEISLVWEHSPSVKTITTVTKADPLRYLSLRIAESMEKYALFAGLAGLTATGLRVGARELPASGLVGEWLKSGDVVTFALTSMDIWLSVELRCPAAGIAILWDAKVSFSLSLLKFRALIFEYAISLLRSRGQDPGYSLSCFHLSKKQEQKSLSFGCSPSELQETRKSFDLEDSKRVGDCFDYLSSSVTSTLAPEKCLPVCPLEEPCSDPEVLSPLFPIRKLKLIELASLESPRKLLRRPLGPSVQSCKGCTVI